MCYFPNQKSEDMNMEAQLRSIASQLPEQQIYNLYEIFTAAHPNFTTTKFQIEENIIIVYQDGRKIVFPRPLPMVKLGHVSCHYKEWLKRKYSLPNFVEVDTGDIVIDCGAYVGGFSIGAALQASEVHAFEPEQHNYNCASKNLEQHSNVVMNCKGLYNATRQIELNVSSSSVEHSILMPDDGPPISQQTIGVITLKDYCETHKIEHLDFVKIEAEGVELEVFEGLGAIRPKKFAIDVSPERNSLSPAEDLTEYLLDQNYEVRQRHHMLFARRK